MYCVVYQEVLADGKPSGKIHRVEGQFESDDEAGPVLAKQGFSFIEDADTPHWEGVVIDGDEKRAWATVEYLTLKQGGRRKRTLCFVCQDMVDGKPSGEIHRVEGRYRTWDEAGFVLERHRLVAIEGTDTPHYEGMVRGRKTRVWATVEPLELTHRRDEIHIDEMTFFG